MTLTINQCLLTICFLKFLLKQICSLENATFLCRTFTRYFLNFLCTSLLICSYFPCFYCMQFKRRIWIFFFFFSKLFMVPNKLEIMMIYWTYFIPDYSFHFSTRTTCVIFCNIKFGMKNPNQR